MVPHASEAVANSLWVDSLSQLNEMIEHLFGAPWVGVDTEFVRERTYYPAPGLVQISDGQKVWLVDVMALPNLDQLTETIRAEKSQFIFHSVGEDLEVMSLLMTKPLSRLFDTQVAAALIGFPAQMRYEHLIKAVFDTELMGGQARANWRQRPLSPAMLEYAAQDVIYLPKLAECLSERLSELGRLSWHEEECQRLLEKRALPSNQPLYIRVKGAGRLSPMALAFLDSLASWRDKAAKEKNLPRSFVIKDDALIDIATRVAHGSINSALSAHQKTLGSLLLDCRATLESTSVDDFEPSRWIKPLSPDQRKQLKYWQSQVRTIATELNIDPTIIASKSELTRLLHGEHPTWLTGWRKPFFEKRDIRPQSPQIIGESS